MLAIDCRLLPLHLHGLACFSMQFDVSLLSSSLSLSLPSLGENLSGVGIVNLCDDGQQNRKRHTLEGSNWKVRLEATITLMLKRYIYRQ